MSAAPAGWRDIALAYVETYCRTAGTSRRRVFRWLSFIAAGRPTENARTKCLGFLNSATQGRTLPEFLWPNQGMTLDSTIIEQGAVISMTVTIHYALSCCSSLFNTNM
jgi:hypothetical protein